jgi:hypothetical protein
MKTKDSNDDNEKKSRDSEKYKYPVLTVIDRACPCRFKLTVIDRA